MPYRAFIMGLALIFGCSSALAKTPSENAEAGLQAQMADWNRGDLEAALTHYWNSDRIIWVNSKGRTQGFQAFADAMRADYAGRAETMGIYSAEILERRDLSPKRALIVARWRIDREGKRLFGGVSTQIWEKIGRNWVITLEHAS